MRGSVHDRDRFVRTQIEELISKVLGVNAADVHAAVRAALACKASGEKKVILTALCGHGHFAMAAYRSFLDGQLVDYEYPDDKVREAMEKIPVVASPL